MNCSIKNVGWTDGRDGGHSHDCHIDTYQVSLEGFTDIVESLQSHSHHAVHTSWHETLTRQDATEDYLVCLPFEKKNSLRFSEHWRPHMSKSSSTSMQI